MESVELKPVFVIELMLNEDGKFKAPVLKKVNSIQLILTEKNQKEE
ncbi:hypothetical protein ACK1LH_10745 [Metabacillus indicus]